MAVRKTVSIVFNRENTATFEQFTCYVDKQRRYKMTKYAGQPWNAFEYENKEWKPISISGLDAQYMRDRIVKYHEAKTGEVMFDGATPQRPIYKKENGRLVFDVTAMNNWLVGDMTPLAKLMPR
jgi:hypothetical protein